MNIESPLRLPGLNASSKALESAFREQPQPTDLWVKDASYTRLDHITLGYSFQNVKGVQTLRFYFTATNLFVITPYQGYDPEISVDGSQRYIDYNYYPKTRGLILGVKMGL